MNHLDMVLAARAFSRGRALRRASVRHRHLAPGPLAVVLWQLGAEPFSAAAVAWGCGYTDTHLAVAGEPRNRELAFRALLGFARWFNEQFEAPAADRETVARGKQPFTRARTAPQVLAANPATVEMLGRLGRRLAYLPTTGAHPADETLVRLGRHLRFLWDHWAVPGQQLVVSLTELLNDHWVTAQSEMERQSLGALDAWIEPRPGEHGFTAAARAEQRSVGPIPAGDEDERLEPLVKAFNANRAGSTDPGVVVPLLGPIKTHYAPLVRHTWDLLWRCRDREATFPEAPSAARRWEEDREAYTRHIDWLNGGGLRRTRQSARQAAFSLHRLENAGKRLEAEEACDDPARMVRYLLEHKAVCGRVVSVDRSYKEVAEKRAVARPLVRLASPDPCLMPPGKELWWSDNPAGPGFVVHAVEPGGAGSLVTLKLLTSRGGPDALPAVGGEATFSVHRTGPGHFLQMPESDPWTHRPAGVGGAGPAGVGPIEDTAERE